MKYRIRDIIADLIGVISIFGTGYILLLIGYGRGCDHGRSAEMAVAEMAVARSGLHIEDLRVMNPPREAVADIQN
jgi:hypothetical protein